MKISFLIAAIVLHAVRVVLSNNNIQVGTVLFTTTDIVKKCWSESDKALLRARFIMQDVLPHPDCIDFSKPNVVLVLLDYFQACFDIITKSTYGKLQNLMCLALSDALGGYLRAYALPLTKASYYAGLIRYNDASKLFELYNDIRVFLKTNGEGWSKPRVPCSIKFPSRPLFISSAGKKEACEKLFFIEKKKPPKSKICDEKDDNDNYDYDDNKTDNDFVTDFSDVSLTQNRKEKVPENPNDSLEDLLPFENRRIETRSRWPNSQEEAKSQTQTQSEKLTKTLTGRDGGRKFRDRKSSRVLKKKVKRRFLEQKTDFTKVTEEFLKNNNYTCWHGLKRQKLPTKSKDETYMKKRKYRRKCRKQKHRQTNEDECEEGTTSLSIPLPALEDGPMPHTIAVPFKCQPLRNLQAPSSAFILQHYYIDVIKCMICKGTAKDNVRNFNYEFNSWLLSQVFPHLTDEEWYPAFGGVHRITETIKAFGAEPSYSEDSDSDNLGFIFSNSITIEDSNENEPTAEGKEITQPAENCLPPRKYYVMGLMVLIMIAVIACCSCCFCWHGIKGDMCDTFEDTRSSQIKTDKFMTFQFLVKLFKKPDYCDDKTQGCCDFNKKKKCLAEFDNSMKGDACFREGRTIKENEERRRTNTRPSKIKFECKDENSKKKGEFQHIVSRVGVPDHRFDKSVASVWPCSTSPIPFAKMVASSNMGLGLRRAGNVQLYALPRDKVRTIWRNPSTRCPKHGSSKAFDTKGLSRSTSCDCSCVNSQMTSSKSSFSTQIDEKMSSATIEVSEQVLPRSKPDVKVSVTGSHTTESHSEIASYSSESDVSRMT